MDVAPFGEAQERDELRAAGVDAPAVRQPLPVEPGEELPQRDQRQEVGALVAEPEVRLVGGLLLFQRPVARIGHRQRGGDDQHLGQAAALARREHHPPDAGIDRQPREIAAQRRQRARVVDGAQLLQQLVAVGDRARPGASRNGNASTSPRSSDAIRRITAASELRRISGSV